MNDIKNKKRTRPEAESIEQIKEEYDSKPQSNVC